MRSAFLLLLAGLASCASTRTAVPELLWNRPAFQDADPPTRVDEPLEDEDDFLEPEERFSEVPT